jgi:hypothetical protein
MNDFKKGNFVNDAEKMRDFHRLTKEEFLQSYSYLTEEEYDNTLSIVNAKMDYMKFRDRLFGIINSMADRLNEYLHKHPFIANARQEEYDYDINEYRTFVTPTFVRSISGDGYFVGSVALPENIFYGEDYDYELNELTTESLLDLVELCKHLV